MQYTNVFDSPHVVVVGAGNAGLCAALSAREAGAEVTVLERAPYEERGGNSRFTAGAMRVAYDDADDLRTLMPDLAEDQWAISDFGEYPADAFFDDLARVTEYRADPDLAWTLVEQSLPTLQWMREKGVRFLPIYGRQAFKVDGRFTFWGGLVVEANGGGPGLVDALTTAAENAGVRIRYGTRASSLVTSEGRTTGVRVKSENSVEEIPADAVVLSAGGFQANAQMRAAYLGPNWDLAKVRGTKYNTGDGIRMALDAGANPAGHWSGCHAVGWELNAPEFGDLAVGDAFQKHSYPFSIMVNRDGHRFVDEGADFRNYTYAKYGGRILAQPGQLAWQIFDSKTLHLLRDEYRIRQVTRVRADTLEDLVAKMEGIDAEALLAEIAAYNAAVDDGTPFNPNVKDGRATHGLEIPKSNWANRIDEGPFEAYAVTCGVTFTFGGVRINTSAEVLDDDLRTIPGLYAVGEMAGGIFYFNYPGGSGLTNGAVYGRIAGREAAKAALARLRATA